MQINIVYDPSADSAPAGFKTAVNEAVDFFDSLVTNNISLTIEFGWGAAGSLNADLPDVVADAQPSTANYTPIGGSDASDLMGALDAAYAANGLATIVTPWTIVADFQNPASRYVLTDAQIAALGLDDSVTPGGAPNLIALNSTESYNFDVNGQANTADLNAVSALIHEIGHVLGRIDGQFSTKSILDLFKNYPSGFFSLTGEALTLPFDTSNDTADWAPGVLNDANGYASLGTGYKFSAVDMLELEALGYSLNAHLPPILISTTPLHGAFEITTNPVIELDFNEPVTRGSGSIEIYLTPLGQPVGGPWETIDVADTSQVVFQGAKVVVTPSRALQANTSFSVEVGPGAITDASGLAYPGFTDPGVLRFQTGTGSASDVSSITYSTSAPVVGAGDELVITVHFKEPVVSKGDTTLGLNQGAAVEIASSDPTALNYRYVVQPVAEAAGLKVVSLSSPPGDLLAAAGGPLNLSFVDVPQQGPQVDPVLPTLTQIFETPMTGTVGVGDKVTFTARFTYPVSVSGAPTLILNNGAAATYVGGSGSRALTFQYTVGADDAFTSSAIGTAFDLTHGAIHDLAGYSTAQLQFNFGQIGPLVAVNEVVAVGRNIDQAAGTTTTIDAIFAGADNPLNHEISQYRFLDAGGDGGHLTLNGVAQPDGQWVVVTPSHVNDLGYVAGPSPGSDLISIEAFDATNGSWSAPASVTASVSTASLEGIWMSSLRTYVTPGQTATIELNFDLPVTVTGAPTLTLNDGEVASYESGSGSNYIDFTYAVGWGAASVPVLAVDTINLNGGSLKDASGAAADLSVAQAPQGGLEVWGAQKLLADAFANVLFVDPASTLATTPTVALRGGGSVTNPIYTLAQALPGLTASVMSGQTTLGAAYQTIEHWGDASTTVASIAYQFFTGSTPSPAGFGYLVNGGSNPNDLDGPYYAQFHEQNRFINFASNLGKFGVGEAGFSAAYGSLTLADAVTKAYATIFGFTPAPGKVDALLSAQVAPGETRADYFGFYGQDGPNGLGTKAAAVGWLMTVAVQADLGVYAAANDAFLDHIAIGIISQSDLFVRYPAMTAAQAAAMEAQVALGASIVNPVQVADAASNVLANLDSLQGIAASSKLASITLTDPTVPTLQLTAVQIASDGAAISAIAGPYAGAVTGLASQLTGETIGQFTTAGSFLDVTDLNRNAAGFTALFAENDAGTQGVLTLNDGTHAVSIALVGQLAAAGFSGAAGAAGFTFANDSGSGVLVGWHA